jgi:hypothetical protein
MDLASLVAAAVGGQTESVTVNKVSSGVYDAATGDVVGDYSTSYSGIGIFTSLTGRTIDGLEIRDGDLVCELLADGLTWEPQAGDMLVRGTQELAILSTEARPQPGGTIAWRLHVRGDGS